MNAQDLVRMSEAWWLKVRADEALLLDWLRDQFHGEDTAAERIEQFRDTYALSGRWTHVLSTIAGQERLHASWVGDLLRARGEEPTRLVKSERYWEETIPSIHDFESGAAVAAHAEEMRLARIQVIANDPQAPADIRSVFARILPDERFHARAFAKMAGKEAFARAQERHESGLKAIHLIPPEAV